MPIWGPEAITLQPIRAGFPCFGAALAGYVEATRDDDDEKNRLCPPSSLRQHASPTGRRMNVLGMRNSASFGSEPDIKAWTDRVALNPGARPTRAPGLARSSTTHWSGCSATWARAGPAGRAELPADRLTLVSDLAPRLAKSWSKEQRHVS